MFAMIFEKFSIAMTEDVVRVEEIKKNLNYFTFHSEILVLNWRYLLSIVLHNFHKVQRANVEMFAIIFEKISIAMTEDVVWGEESEEKPELFHFPYWNFKFWIDAFSYHFTRFRIVERANVEMFALIFEKFSLAMTEDVVRVQESEEKSELFHFP